MRYKKLYLDEIYRCYSTMSMKLDGELNLFFASEEKGHPAYAYSGVDFKEKKTVWENGGGTMSMIPVPNRENQFLAIMDFYLKETPSNAKLTLIKYEGKDVFKQHDLLYLPYLHRFDLFEVDGVVFFVGATIAHRKENKEDWSSPGKIYVAKLPSDLSQPVELRVLKEGLPRNHGYYRSNDGSCGYFASDKGVLKITPPSHTSDDWKVEEVIDGKISEIALIDIDGDSIEEIITIEPFHGNAIYIYKLMEGTYQRVFKYPYMIDFAHALVGAEVAGVKSFIGGVRRVNSELFMIQFINGEFVITILEEGVGPANVAVTKCEGYDLIHSANHTQNHAAVYIVKE